MGKTIRNFYNNAKKHKKEFKKQKRNRKYLTKWKEMNE